MEAPGVRVDAGGRAGVGLKFRKIQQLLGDMLQVVGTKYPETLSLKSERKKKKTEPQTIN